VAERVKRRFSDDQPQSYDLGSTFTLVAHVLASLDKKLYNYLCLVASDKQQLNLNEIKKAIGKLGKW